MLQSHSTTIFWTFYNDSTYPLILISYENYLLRYRKNMNIKLSITFSLKKPAGFSSRMHMHIKLLLNFFSCYFILKYPECVIKSLSQDVYRCDIWTSCRNYMTASTGQYQTYTDYVLSRIRYHVDVFRLSVCWIFHCNGILYLIFYLFLNSGRKKP